MRIFRSLRRNLRYVFIIIFLISIQIFYNLKTPQEGRLVLHVENYWNGEKDTTKEPNFTGPVDLVYLWVNGSDPKFILEMKRQKASEEFYKYKRPVKCRFQPDTELSFHVIVVYPALHSTKSLLENNSIEYIRDVTDKDMKYSIIIPKESVKGIMNTLSVIEGQTYISMCGSIGHRNVPKAKKTLQNMYIVISNTLKTLISVMKKISEGGADYVFKHDEKSVRYNYTLICYQRHASSDTFKKLIEDLQMFNVDIYPAILSWDTNSIKIEGLPDKNRYAENDQLIYSVRSVEMYAPWIRHIYIVCNDQTPSWLNTSNNRISVISTEDIFPNKDDLPTFSSPAIESHMYRIPGLSETFIFMCDDFFFAKPITLRDFYTEEEGLKMRWYNQVPTCWLRCFNTMLGNGKCDSSCDNLICGWDHGECRNITQYHIKQNYKSIFGGIVKGSVYNTIAMFNKRGWHFDGVFHYRYPPHRPLLVNKRIAADLYKTFQAEFKMSSAIHFRSQFNVQYTLAYMLFVSTTYVTLTPEHIFDELDKDKSGTVSFDDLEESQSLRFKSIRKEIDSRYIIDVAADCIREFANNTSRKDKIIQRSKQLTRSEFVQCSKIVDLTITKGTLKPKYKWTLDTEDNYDFITLTNTLTQAKSDLNSIIDNPRKFVCINDDIDHSTMAARAVELELRNFYERLFPKPSQYERRVS